jgi:8-oxo-dGTP diphosphatase
LTRPTLRVAAAVLLRPDGAVLLAQRPAGKPYAGYWEFPGGKIESGETPHAALCRELREELDIVVRNATPWFLQEFDYPHAHVELHFFRVRAWDGELLGKDGQAFVWQTPGHYTVGPLLPANTRILAALVLPPMYGITCAGELGEDVFLERARRALAQGLSLVQLREKDWPLVRRDEFSAALLPLAHRHGAKVLLNGTAEDARRLGCDGVHWPAAVLAQALERPADLLVAASCHTREEIARAGHLALDFAVLGSVAFTPTHPTVQPLGWDGFAAAIAATRLPVYALGGMTAADLKLAITCGAQGIAMMRGAWPSLQSSSGGPSVSTSSDGSTAGMR